VGQLEYLDRLGLLDTDFRIAHAVQFQAEHADLLAGRTLRVAHCPSANLKLGSGIADLVRLRATPGIVVGIGCDGAPCNNDMDVLEEVRLAALLQSIRQGPGHFGAMEALELATIEGARAIGWEDEIGSLEPGKAADVVVLDLRKPASFGASSVSMYDRIVYGTARDAVAKVYVAGRELVADGRLVGVDMPELLKRSTESIDAIVRRARL
jgi:cytosine/adenosine deaminase-related metal-dependent hydrolase